MLELKVQEPQGLQPIVFNFEELKKELAEQLEKYKGVVYTEETMKVATEDRAKLNKLSKAVNDRKIEINKKVKEAVLDNFNDEIKTILEMINEPITLIDTQIKEYEQKQKDEKKKEIQKIFDEAVGDYANLVSLDNIFNDRWLNKTYKISAIKTDIEHVFIKTESDLKVIEGQMKDENVAKQTKDYYFRNISNPSVLSLSLQEGLRIIEANQKLEELNKKEEKATEMIQNVSKNENNSQKVEESSQKMQENLQNAEKVHEVNFKVWVTVEQLHLLQNFLEDNKIQYKGEK